MNHVAGHLSVGVRNRRERERELTRCVSERRRTPDVDGNEAIDLVQKAYEAGAPYQIVFLDWNMPTISGLEVLSYFRAKSEYTSTAFVMLTAESEQQNIMKAIKAGATSYIIKPVSPIDLGKKLFEIHEWIKRKRQTTHAMSG